MAKMLIIDHEKCTGCRFCEVACAAAKEGVSNPTRARVSLVKWEMEGSTIPMVCQQCQDAPCVTVCPVKALSRDEALGRVVIDYDLCIGCKFCIVVCPFGGMGFDTIARRVIKCDLCDGDPSCVKACTTDAIQFVDVSTVNVMKKRKAAAKIEELIKRFG
jgi:carbon-monoxide dehydrogenase iron sulfur subunit